MGLLGSPSVSPVFCYGWWALPSRSTQPSRETDSEQMFFQRNQQNICGGGGHLEGAQWEVCPTLAAALRSEVGVEAWGTCGRMASQRTVCVCIRARGGARIRMLNVQGERRGETGKETHFQNISVSSPLPGVPQTQIESPLCLILLPAPSPGS